MTMTNALNSKLLRYYSRYVMILKSVDYFVFSMSKEVENQGVVRSRRSNWTYNTMAKIKRTYNNI
jgi:hypothetical protein